MTNAAKDQEAGVEGAQPRLLERIDRLRDSEHAADARRIAALTAWTLRLESDPMAGAVCPYGLGAMLKALRRELGAHHMREQLTLFPMMQAGSRGQIQYVICRMMDEHEVLLLRLDRLCGLVELYRPLIDTLDGWRGWAAAFDDFATRLRKDLGDEEQDLFLQFF